MLIALIVFCIVVSVAAAFFKDLLPHIIQYGFFLRFPFLIGLLLVLLAFAQSSFIPDLFEFEQQELIEVTALALLAAWTCLSTAVVLADAAPHRFGVARLPLPRWFLRWGIALSSLLAVPLLIKIGWSTRNDPWVLPKMALGVVCALAAQWVLRVIRQLFVPPDERTPLTISPALVPKFVIQAQPLRWVWTNLLPPERLRKFPRVIGAGYISYGRGTIQPGPMWLLVLLGIVSLGCTYSNESLNWRLAHNQPVTFMPPMAYLEISLILLALLLSGLSFFLDRYRISVVLVVLLWIVVPYWTNSAGHYFMIHQADCATGGNYDEDSAVCSGRRRSTQQ